MSRVEQVLNSLRKHVENIDNGWGEVYLDNALPPDMKYNQFRACLSALSRKGLYRVIDGYAFGKVKVEV